MNEKKKLTYSGTRYFDPCCNKNLRTLNNPQVTILSNDILL